MLEFFETFVFTRQIIELLDDHEYAGLQGALVVDPEAGDLIRGTGGLRKIRWVESRRSKGKRGGIRVIYYWYASGDAIYMLFAYSKDQRDDLTVAQKKMLKRLVEEELE